MAYVYRHIRLDKNEPFYIGVSVNKYRPHQKTGSGRTRNRLWANIAAKTKYEVEILFDNVSVEFAKSKEIEFIKLYGRKDLGTGTLANLTNGGEGTYGVAFTEERRLKMSKSMTGKRTGHKHSEETKNLIRLGNLGREISDYCRVVTSKRMKGKPAYNKGKKMPAHQYEFLSKTLFVNRRIAVCKYDLMGNKIEVYVSVIDAARRNNIGQGNITNACNKSIMYGGYLWRYVINGEPGVVAPYEMRVNPVVQMTMGGEIIAEYSNCSHASRVTGFQKSSILRVCRGVYKQAYNFKWQFKTTTQC